MVVLRKRVPSQAAERLQASADSKRGPVDSSTPSLEREPVPPPTTSENERILVGNTKGLTIETKQPQEHGLGIQLYNDDPVQSPTTSMSQDYVQSPSRIAPSDSFFSSPTTMTSSDAFFRSSSTMTPSDGFFQTPATSVTSEDLIHSPTSVSSTEESPSLEKSKSKWTAAMEDARIFAGGLIRHPFESTKHFTILRHSHGLIYYKGSSTSIAITIFSDQPLPPDRRLWLQMKGWTGKTGMRAKALLRTNGSWINVTPSMKVDASQLPPMDERAWRRDINKFLDKAHKHKQLRKHAVRETAVVRVPFEAVDGYFRVVLTKEDNRAPMCPSPVFRVASTSMSMSSIKGASLSTLPVELGMKILQYTAKQAASNAVMPLGNTVRQQVSPYLPSFWVQEAASAAYGVTGVQGKVDAANYQFDCNRESLADGSPAQYIGLARPDIVGSDLGPDSPFPIRLNGRIVRGSGNSTALFGIPTSNLASLPDDIVAPLSGTYFGWALISPHDKSQEELHSSWKQSIISVAPCPYTAPTVAPKKTIKAYLIHDFSSPVDSDTENPHPQFFDSKISLVLMGYLRPCIPYSDREAFFYETVKDIAITRASLERDEWGPENSLEKINSAKSARSISDRYVDARKYGQRLVDRVPVHKVGIRTPSAGFKDREMFGNGGMYVVRG